MNELKARRCAALLRTVCDGLTGLPAAVTACWPAAIVQTCIVHLVRASVRWVNYKDRKRVTSELRKIYNAPTDTGPQSHLHDEHDREHQPPAAEDQQTRGHFPNDDALVKLRYLGCKELGRTDIRGREGRGGRSNYNWKVALNQFDIMFPGRLDRA